ncbi:MAG: hypothetical protein FWG77_00875 [Treponema sp.]|nr:hypothetical protein [Treponema sp.]
MTLGIAGTAKNTGKTTTMSAIMEEIRKDSAITLGITSIGYDGEGFDNITGLPKPRINVWPGIILAIAMNCIKFCTAGIEIIKKTDIQTPLGKLMICRIIKPGKVLLAGANKGFELRIILDLISEYSNMIIVDGALNRIAPMTELDFLILVTGAARYTDINRLADESACFPLIFSRPVLKETGRVDTVDSVLNDESFLNFMEKCNSSDTLIIKGVIAEKYLKRFLDLKPGGKRLIFNDPVKLLLSGDPLGMKGILSNCSTVEIGVAKQLKLIAMTVNPYYPEYRNNNYFEAFIDAEILLKTVSSYVNIPCFDVVKQGAGEIYDILKSFQE